jgi:exopolysaccharide biosynthesis polyprenyl glycosylphosphotransferase
MSNQKPQEDLPVTISEGVVTIELPERLTVLEAIAFKWTCNKVLDKNPPPQEIILNFSNTRFMDSSGIGAIVYTLKATRDKQVMLVFRDIQPPVMAVFSMTGLDMVIKIQNTLQQYKETMVSKAVKSELPETHPSVRSWLKRFIDIIGSLVGLGITGLLFIPIAIAIKSDSPGPIFFKQTRCGWMGKHFQIWKFRSMCLNAEQLKKQVNNQASGAFFKNEHDPRITKIGRFLRRTSLDELPQFWNVLKGEMSLVGTRPPTPDEVEHYEVPEWQRLDVKPGMTGEWQVNGRSKIRNFEDVIKLDLRYQQNWSLKYDIQLILKTIWILFHKSSGAV